MKCNFNRLHWNSDSLYLIPFCVSLCSGFISLSLFIAAIACHHHIRLPYIWFAFHPSSILCFFSASFMSIWLYVCMYFTQWSTHKASIRRFLHAGVNFIWYFVKCIELFVKHFSRNHRNHFVQLYSLRNQFQILQIVSFYFIEWDREIEKERERYWRPTAFKVHWVKMGIWIARIFFVKWKNSRTTLEDVVYEFILSCEYPHFILLVHYLLRM